jgi:hypothetical protein
MTDYKTIRARPEAYTKIEQWAADKGLKQVEVIDKLVSFYQGRRHLEEEMEQLKQENETLRQQLQNLTIEKTGAGGNVLEPKAMTSDTETHGPPFQNVTVATAPEKETRPNKGPLSESGIPQNQNQSPSSPSLPTAPLGTPNATGTIASSNSRSSSTTELTNLTHGETATIQLSPRQLQTLAFEREKLQLKVAAARTIEQEKRETHRQTRYRRVQDEFSGQPRIDWGKAEGDNSDTIIRRYYGDRA